jgi:hypothetical protein
MAGVGFMLRMPGGGALGVRWLVALVLLCLEAASVRAGRPFLKAV